MVTTRVTTPIITAEKANSSFHVTIGLTPSPWSRGHFYVVEAPEVNQKDTADRLVVLSRQSYYILSD
jgi:hypothetical protein